MMDELKPAVYREIGDPEIDSNPLSAHLNDEPEDLKDAYKKLKQKIDFNPEDRFAKKSFRRRKIRALRNCFIPADPVCARTYLEVSSTFIASYIPRNPLTAAGQAYLHRRGPANDFKPGICLINGHSGMGKSTLARRILACMGQHVVPHTSFKGVPFTETQLLYLRRNIPPKCTPTMLARTMGSYVDSLLPMPLYGKAFSRIANRGGGQDVYMDALDKICRAHFVGGIVLDEIQNLLGSGAKRDHVIQLLVNLHEEAGLPIVLIGTPKALRLLEGDFAPARRLAEGGYFELVRPLSYKDVVWDETCKRAWAYQWLQEPAEYSEEICETLYECAQGVNGVMISLLVNAQLLALEENLETVDAKLLKRTYEERMQPIHRAIRSLESGDAKQIETFDDLSADFFAKERQYEDAGGGTQSVTVPAAEIFDEQPAPTKLVRRNQKREKQEPILRLSPEKLRAQVYDSDSMRSIIATLRPGA